MDNIKSATIELLAKNDIFIGENFKKGKMAFLFPGHGSQYPNMLKSLYKTNKIVKDIFDEADNIFLDLYGEKLSENIFYDREEEKLHIESNLKKAKIMQASIYTCNYALYKLLSSMNQSPDFLCGHSLGEISALCAAGVISFADGLKIVYYRADALDMIPEYKRGGMISVSISRDDKIVDELLNCTDQECNVSLNNAPNQIVISGSDKAIHSIEIKCKEKNLSYNVLEVSHAFHSTILKESVEYYYNRIKDIKFKNHNIPIYSTIEERLYTEDDFVQGDFAKVLAKQLVTPFSFCEIIKDMNENLDVNVFVEVGCKNILTRLVKNILKEKEFYAIETNLKAKEDRLCIERFKNYMDVNNLNSNIEINNYTDYDYIESKIKNIIKLKTGYPDSFININDKPMIFELALNKYTFKAIISSVKSEFNIINDDLEREDISLKEIIRAVSSLKQIVNIESISDRKALNIESENSIGKKADTEKIESQKIVDKSNIEKEIKRIVFEKTGYPEEMLENDLDLEADLGIDSVKQGEIFATVRETFNYQMDENADIKEFNTIGKIIDYTVEKVEISSADEVIKEISMDIETVSKEKSINIDEIEKEIKRIVFEKTGYPEEMLENDLDLEADLGIDSVKQGEIFATVREAFNYQMDENADIKEFNTIGKIIDYTAEKVDISSADEVVKEISIDTETVSKEKSIDIDKIEKEIKRIVFEKTGYPEEMLENDLDLEADLGIDSVKQGEIFATVREAFNYQMDENADIKEFNTIGKIIDYTVEKVKISSADEVVKEISIDTETVSKEKSIDIDEIEKEIKRIVFEKTGYPEEMLENDLDLEADLGIDSVKQGEIFATVREAFNYQMDENADIKEFNTIGKIIDYTIKALGNKPALKAQEKKDIHEILEELKSEEKVTTRYIGISVEKKYPNNAEIFDFKDKYVVIVEDRLDKAITSELVNKLYTETSNIYILGNGKYEKATTLEINFNDIDNLKDSLKKAMLEIKKIDVIINLNGIRKAVDFESVDYETWNSEVSEIYNVIFYTSKYAYKYFEENHEESAYFAATNIGGIFGVEDEFINNPLGAIITGYLKGLEKELRPFNCKVCDFTDMEDSKDIAETLYKDFKVRENLVEIGYCNNVRKTVCVVPQEIKEKNHITPFKLDSSDVILVSGGGRGIILECVKGLSKLYNPKIIITGRTEFPSGNEKWIKFNDAEMEEYKSEFMRELLIQKKVKTPFEAVEKYNKLLNAKELYKNIMQIREDGYDIHYVKCDICDDKDTDRLAQYIKDNFGNVTGIINGAGLPSFGKVTKKNEQFALKVVRVKADGFYNMYNKFKNNKLKFFVSMGSISGRFGMDGQVDYSAGADIIVKLTSLIKNDNKDLRATVLGWTAWDEVGMAADPQVQKVQKEVRKLEYIKVKEGVERFLNEIAFGCNYNEVLFFGNIGEENMPLGQLDLLDTSLKEVKVTIGENGEVNDRREFPLLETVEQYERGHSIVCKKKLNKISDIHLRDHMVEGNSVFAGVMHIETACELVKMFQHLEDKQDKYNAAEILNYNFDKFIKYFEGNKLELKIKGEVSEISNEKEVMKVTILSDFVNKKGLVLEKDRVHSYGDIIFKKDKEPVKMTDINIKELIKQSSEIDMDKYYGKASGYITFGETFRCITYAGMVNENQMVGKIRVPSDEIYFSYAGTVDSIISPVTIDNVGRFMLLNDYVKNGYTIVPKKITKAIKRRDFRINEEVYVNCIFIGEDGTDVTYSAQVIGEDGDIIFEIEEMILVRINKENNDHNIFK